MDNFRSIDEIPLPYRNIFTEYPCFNAVQSQVLDDILYTDNSVVVSGPTGSGKTVIFELAVIRLLTQYENIDMSQKIKIVYICPIKALCHERLSDWHKKFSPFGLNCVAATGDSENFEFQHLTNHNLIISTPEKWDSLTRRWKDHEKIVKVVKLFMIDEVHLLNEENRGSTLEVIVCRMKTVENAIAYSEDKNDIFNQKVRFIALSATVPNVEDIAQWIGKPSHTKHYKFSEEMRPVKLKRVVYGYSYNLKAKSPFKFDISLNYKLPSLIMQYSEGKPTLIFCSTRKSVEMTAQHLLHSLKIHLNEEQTQKLSNVANLITEAKAKAIIRHGVGYHHAGMIPETRHAVENLFRDGDLPVLVTTSTLAMGVNLPAHLVIVKSTKCYDVGGFRDYTETAIHQMIGRAGRPQFDTSATALILTTNEDKHKFEKMVSCGQPIESNLHRHLTEHLNAEIVLRTITELDVAMQWLSSTFLYVRARKNPHHYGINVGYTQEQIDKKLLEMCQIDLNKLVRNGMITIDQNIVITPNVTGKIMAKYYIAFETMKLFTQISGTEILMQILGLISKCQEFAPMRLRVNDKKTLNLLNKNSKKNTIRFPLNGRIKTWDMKVNCIIQAVLGNLDILDHSILNESLTIMRNGERIAKCLIEYLETRGPNCYSALLNAVILAKCFHAKLWENSPFVSKQLTGIGNVMSNQLTNAGKTTFKKIVDSNPRDLELIIKKKPPMGNKLVEEAVHIPFYKMSLEKLASGKQLELCISLENVDDVREKSTVNVRSTMILLVGNNSNGILVYEKYAHSYMMEQVTVKKIIDVNTNPEEISAHFISDDWVGIDCNSKLETQSSNVKKSNKQGESTNSHGPTYMQMFLDMYMKIKKKVPAEKKVAKQDSTTGMKKSKDVEKQDPTSIDHIKTETESEEFEKDIQVRPPNFVTKANNDVQEIEELPLENDLDICQESLFSDKGEDLEKGVPGRENLISEVNMDEDVTEAKCADMENLNNDLPEPSNLINIKERVSKAPLLFSIAKKYGMGGLEKDENNQSTKLIGTYKRKSEHADDSITLEDSLYKEDARKKQTLQEFKFPIKKKFSHNPQKKDLPDSTVDNHYYTVTEILEPREKEIDISDLNEYESDMEKPLKERSKDNIQKSITWRSPLVFSPAEKYSPKIHFPNISAPKDYAKTDTRNEINNETFETSTSSRSNTNFTINMQRTPKLINESNIDSKRTNKNRATFFPLRDGDYERSWKDQRVNEPPFDICSDSFLEMFGLPNKSTPKFKKTIPSPTVNYYSQLLSQPIQIQKHKPQETPQRNLQNVENKANFSISEEPAPIKIPNSEFGDNLYGEGFNSSLEIRPDRGNIRKPLQDMRVHEGLVLTQNSPLLYSNARYTPQMDLNGSYLARSTPHFIERHPHIYTQQDYESTGIPNYSRQEKYQNSAPAPYNYCNYPKIRQRTPFRGNICGRTYRDIENIPPYSNRDFERTIDLNQSQFVDNPNCEDFYRQRQHLTRRDNSRYQLPPTTSERDYRIFNNSQANVRQKYPEMMSLQDLNQHGTQRTPASTQATSLVQRKSFEKKRRETDPRSIEDFLESALQENFTQNYADDNTRFLQGRSSRAYQREYPRNPSSSLDAFNYRQNTTDRTRNNFDSTNLVKNFDRSFPFEEDTNLAQKNFNLPRSLNGVPEQVYSQQNVDPPCYPKSTFSQDWDLREQDFRNQNDFALWQNSNLNRGFMAPTRMHYPEQTYRFPPSGGEMEIFPPDNDKEYVMNKFLFSLNQQ